MLRRRRLSCVEVAYLQLYERPGMAAVQNRTNGPCAVENSARGVPLLESCMFISYRRSGGMLALLTFAAVALAATVLTVAVAATVLMVGVAVTAARLLMGAVRPGSRPPDTVSPAAPWAQDTIEGTVVDPVVRPTNSTSIPTRRN
jgi:hypothetical protein